MLTAKRAFNFMMDNGELDNSQLMDVARFSPTAQTGQGFQVRQLASTSGGEQQRGAADVSTAGANVPAQGGQMTSFEKDSWEAAAASGQQGNGMTQSEKEMRDGSAKLTQEQEQRPQSKQPEKPFFGPQPNGDLRIGDDVYLRWKKLPSWANSIIGGVIGNGVFASQGAQIVGGAAASEYLDEHFRWPWLTHEPQNPEEQNRQKPIEVSPNEGAC